LWPVGGRGRERQALVTHKINKLVNYVSSCNQPKLVMSASSVLAV